MLLQPLRLSVWAENSLSVTAKHPTHHEYKSAPKLQARFSICKNGGLRLSFTDCMNAFGFELITKSLQLFGYSLKKHEKPKLFG